MSRVWIAALFASGCAGASYAPYGAAEVEAAQPTYTSQGSSGYEALQTLTAADASYAPGPRAPDADAVNEAPSPPRYAQLQPTSGAATSGSTTPATPDVRETPSQMLIYTAVLVVSVLDVAERQARLIALATEMGGHLAEQSGTAVRVRIPAARFDEFVLAVADVGQVLDRRITVTDVGEEFRDVAIRIQNLEAVRRRFEQMLTQANSVETALAIQRELERVTTELEVLKGRQRYLADQVALSTVTVHFQALATVYPDEHVNLPFPWLRQLGLRNLLRLESP